MTFRCREPSVSVVSSEEEDVEEDDAAERKLIAPRFLAHRAPLGTEAAFGTGLAVLLLLPTEIASPVDNGAVAYDTDVTVSCDCYCC